MIPPNIIIILGTVLLLRSCATLGKCLHLSELENGDEGVCLAELLRPPFAVVTTRLSHPGSCSRTVERGLKRKMAKMSHVLAYALNDREHHVDMDAPYFHLLLRWKLPSPFKLRCSLPPSGFIVPSLPSITIYLTVASGLFWKHNYYHINFLSDL